MLALDVTEKIQNFKKFNFFSWTPCIMYSYITHPLKQTYCDTMSQALDCQLANRQQKKVILTENYNLDPKKREIFKLKNVTLLKPFIDTFIGKFSTLKTLSIHEIVKKIFYFYFHSCLWYLVMIETLEMKYDAQCTKISTFICL